MSNFNVAINGKQHVWSEETVKSKLQKIGALNGKKVAWIQSDLGIEKSTWLTRVIWSVVAKHFSWMRKNFFGVDLQQSRSLLEQIGNQIQDNPNIKDLYQQAVDEFNQIAPRHKLALENESIPLTSAGKVVENPLTSDLNLQGFGPSFWKEYLGLEVEGEIPHPPKNIVEEVRALRESVKGEQEAPGCTLVLMPKGLTANKLIELMENPQKGHSTKLKHIFHGIDNEYGDKENRESYWFLMTNDVIEGSRNKSFQEQKDLVKDKTNGKCHLPTYLEALVGCALHNVKNGEHLLNQKDMTFTRCQCLFEGYPIAVGGLGGLFVNSNFPVGHDHDGALALQKFRP